MCVYITGIGINTSIGSNITDVWDGLNNKKHGIKEITLFDIKNHNNKFACEIKNLNSYLAPPVDYYGRATKILMTALDDALYDAGLDVNDLDKYKVGLCIGTTMGEVEVFEKDEGTKKQGGPHIISKIIKNYYKINGPVWTLTNACAAGNFAIARAMEDIRLNRAEIVIVGGVDSLSWAAFTGFGSLRAMSPDLCRPFDINRKGLILGEGGGVLILESQKIYEKRSNSKPKAKLLGYGLNCDAHHITQPDPNAQGAVKAMEMALLMGKVKREEIQYVNAHGTGTVANDNMEAKALEKLFGNGIYTSSIKGNIGHTLGGASAIEAVICTKILGEKKVPPTLNHIQKDSLCNVNIVANDSLSLDSNYVLSNAFAFGGINSSILLEQTI